MQVLLIKTSSMGDVLHTLPALSDAHRAYPELQVDWLVEGAFAEIPSWHPAVKNVLPVQLRKWRKQLLSAKTRSEWRKFRASLREQSYDIVLDAQGLVKSAFLSYLSHGKRVGLDWPSAREPIASLSYQKKCHVNFYQHAVIRMRELFSQALEYELPKTPPQFGVDKSIFYDPALKERPYLVFLHATTWRSKQWPENYWVELARLAAKDNLAVKISGGNEIELHRAKRIAEQSENVSLLPRQSIASMARLLANAKAAVAVDTGFAHLAVALSIPIISIFGPTNPEFTGVLGSGAENLMTRYPCSPCLRRECQFKAQAVMPPCFTTLAPNTIYSELNKLILKTIV